MRTCDSAGAERCNAEGEDGAIRRPALALVVQLVHVRLRVRVGLHQLRVFRLEFHLGQLVARPVKLLEECLFGVGAKSVGEDNWFQPHAVRGWNKVSGRTKLDLTFK